MIVLRYNATAFSAHSRYWYTKVMWFNTCRPIRAGCASLPDGKDIVDRFPYLSVPVHYEAVVDENGGFVNPGQMIAAQNAALCEAGGAVGLHNRLL